MDKHIDVLGALFIGLGILGTIGMVVVMAIFGLGSGILAGVAATDPEVPKLAVWLPAAFGIFITAIIGVTTVPCYVASYGLFKRRNWARIAALVAGILNVLAVPLGTAVAIYAIWFSFQEEADQFLGENRD